MELAQIDKIVALENVDLFLCCRARELFQISGIAREWHVSRAESIFRSNDAADSLYAVVRGRVALTVNGETLSRLGPGKTFGVLEAITDGCRRQDATAEEDTLLLAIEAEDFIDVLSHNPDVIRAILCRALNCSEPFR
ncbi:MAG: cyclic nucleotide-binding domain-containing protein [Acidobacteria bacterium]|nr:cyclic nucleotide-binding domain-containing protein [Acidobacteriota bacterium]NIQ85125.1 cyclic nucleotide-binding domain-containing protein [Acidobacteriota bacterium]